MKFALRKFGSLIFTLWVIITVAFFMMKAIPGNPFDDDHLSISEEVLANLEKHYELDLPIYQQYLNYLRSLTRFDLGPSYSYKDRPVNAIIREGFPYSFILGSESLLFSLSIGVALGAYAAYKKSQWQDRSIVLITVVGISVPSFIFATLLQYYLAYKWGIFPLARWGSFMHTVLPVISLSAMPIAFITRLTRTNMIEVLNEKYIIAGKARGISPFNLTVKHALRNAILPVIAYLGQMTSKVFVGSFVIEKIFGIPGLGVWLVNGIANRDYPVIMGITIFYSILLLVITFLIDLSFGLLDPRIRLTKESQHA